MGANCYSKPQIINDNSHRHRVNEGKQRKQKTTEDHQINTLETSFRTFKKYSRDVKICIIGDTSVGKTAFYRRVKREDFPLGHDTTPAAGDNAVIYIPLEKYGNVTTCFWDTAGQTRFEIVTGQIIKKSDAI